LAANDKINSKNNPSLKNSSSIYSGTTDLLEQKAWMEDYAFHNKGHRAKWKDRADMEMWVTPSVGYRNWSNNTNEAAAMAYTANNASAAGKSVDQKPSLNLEAGVGIGYSFAKNMKLKMGVQMNYTSYGIRADQTNHPIATTLMLNDLSTGRPYLTTRTSTLSNSSGLQPITVHSTTYQVSVPVGLTVKLAGNEKMGWHAGATLQPSFVMGGMTNFISTDKSGYVSDATLLRRWNMSTGVETYLDYKMNGFSLQVGPQFRYQLFSTYTRKYTVNENLYNMGIKVGLVKNF
ncbi:MAG TPA: outer membrane beta-barrel protein, partial [Ferruginibacter sp.]|nr:outer membrane beta-barrel protein [Ferruginibacter sp.]